ncbi:MAG TPA: DUF4625 domain-containing protein [Lunatimonas sp.]|nr:DUF4625 domain-containing protein [Lunatimonas sp.]
MRKPLLYLLVGATFLAFSCETDDDQIRDLDAPVIGAADGRDAVRPMEEEVNPATKDHLHVRFGVDDPSGIAQIRVDIHSSFDGHSHGRIMTEFERLDIDDIYSPDAANPDFRFPHGATRVSVDGPGTDIYWAGNSSRISGNVLAGPYDFSIQAIDVHGNQTSFGDNSNYLATFYLQTPYAPQISITNLHDGELQGEAGEPLELVGFIRKTDHQLSTDLKFLWVRLAEEDDHGHEYSANARIADGDDFYEKMWGSSTWREGMTGPDLPSSSELNLAEIFTGENAIMMPANEEHLDLIIWVEDTGGNITRLLYEVHVEEY